MKRKNKQERAFLSGIKIADSSSGTLFPVRSARVVPFPFFTHFMTLASERTGLIAGKNAAEGSGIIRHSQVLAMPFLYVVFM